MQDRGSRTEKTGTIENESDLRFKEKNIFFFKEENKIMNDCAREGFCWTFSNKIVYKANWFYFDSSFKFVQSRFVMFQTKNVLLGILHWRKSTELYTLQYKIQMIYWLKFCFMCTSYQNYCCCDYFVYNNDLLTFIKPCSPDLCFDFLQ